MNAMALMNELGMLFFALQKQSVLLFINKSQYRAVKVVLLNCTVHAFVLAKFLGDNCID